MHCQVFEVKIKQVKTACTLSDSDQQQLSASSSTFHISAVYLLNVSDTDGNNVADQADYI